MIVLFLASKNKLCLPVAYSRLADFFYTSCTCEIEGDLMYAREKRGPGGQKGEKGDTGKGRVKCV